jgi:glycosyltransferase involved in cell wall biosynthesis
MNDTVNHPLVSIVTVCLNSERTIQRTINSVLNQSYQNFEYIIVDGKSKDRTIDIVKEYIGKYPEKIQLISEKDRGIYDAMNKGIQRTKGELIGIINSDDWYEQGSFSLVVDNYVQSAIDEIVLYGLLRFYKKNKLFTIKSHSHLFLNEDMIMHPTCFLSKKVYEKHGLFDLRFKYASDYDLMLSLIDKGVEFKLIERIIANMDMNGASVTSFKAHLETYTILRKHNCIGFLDYLVRKFEIYTKYTYTKILKR